MTYLIAGLEFDGMENPGLETGGPKKNISQHIML